MQRFRRDEMIRNIAIFWRFSFGRSWPFTAAFLNADVVACRVLPEPDVGSVNLIAASDRGAYQLAKPPDAAAVVLVGLIAPVEVLSPD